MPPQYLDINAALSFGWHSTLKYWKFFFVVTFGVFAVSFLLNSIDQKNSVGLGALLNAVFNLVILANIYHISVMCVDGVDVEWSNLWTLPVERILRYLGSQIIIGILVLIGLIFLIFPGIYLALRFSQVRYLVIERGSGVWQAMDESGRLTRNVLWSLLGLFIVEIGIALLGAMALGLGLLLAYPVIYLANAHIYRQLTGELPVVLTEPILSL